MTRLRLPGPRLDVPVVELQLTKPWKTDRQQGLTLPLPGRIVVLYWVGRGDSVTPDLRVHELEGHARLFSLEPWRKALAGYVGRWFRGGMSYQKHPDEVYARDVQASLKPEWAYGTDENPNDMAAEWIRADIGALDRLIGRLPEDDLGRPGLVERREKLTSWLARLEATR